MATEIRVPVLGESVTEAIVGKWYKKPGEAVKADEPLVELETDKVTLEVNAPSAGIVSEIFAKEGETVAVGAVLGSIGEGVAAAKPGAEPVKTAGEKVSQAQPNGRQQAATETLSPAVRKAVTENNLDPAAISGTGKDGRILKGDVVSALQSAPASRQVQVPATTPPAPTIARPPVRPADQQREERVRMSKLRQTIARRLKESQNAAAMLTTFNEVDMAAS